jgi:hypothetical protein
VSHTGKKEFCLHLLQKPVVEAKDVGEGAVRDPLFSLEQPNHGWKQSLKPTL